MQVVSCTSTPSGSSPTRSVTVYETHHEEQDVLVLFARLLDHLVHLLTRLSPCRPEIEDRDLVEVPREDLLELFRRVDRHEV